MHLLANGLTCVPQEAWLHPELRLHLPALEHAAHVLEEGGYNIRSMRDECKAEVFYALNWLEAYRVRNTSAYTIPFLSPEYCNALVLEARKFERDIGYTPNKEEDVEYQIPELTLQDNCPALAACLEVLFTRAVVPISKVVHNSNDIVLRSIQLARYEPAATGHGNWHTDSDSDLSVVVSLAPELFIGGGTDIRTGPEELVHIPKLPQGHALMFHGKTTMHRGSRVNSGIRDLLVFWSEYEDGPST